MAHRHPGTRGGLTDYGQRRHALADWSIPTADWTRLTGGLPTRIQTSTWRWRHLPWDERERILVSVWIWYHATHGDRTYNRHMRRDWTDCGRLSPTAKYVNSRWHQLANGDGLYQPLRERRGPYQAAITELVDADQPLNTHATAASGGTTASYTRISGLPNLAT